MKRTEIWVKPDRDGDVVECLSTSDEDRVRAKELYDSYPALTRSSELVTDTWCEMEGLTDRTYKEVVL